MTCFLWLAQLAFLFNQDHLPRDGTAHSGPGLLTSINSQENASTDQSDEGNYSLSKVLSSKKTLVCIKLARPASTLEQEPYGLTLARGSLGPEVALYISEPQFPIFDMNEYEWVKEDSNSYL